MFENILSFLLDNISPEICDIYINRPFPFIIIIIIIISAIPIGIVASGCIVVARNKLVPLIANVTVLMQCCSSRTTKLYAVCSITITRFSLHTNLCIIAPAPSRERQITVRFTGHRGLQILSMEVFHVTVLTHIF